MKKRKKLLQTIAVIAILVIALSTIVAFLANPSSTNPNSEPFTPHYLSYLNTPSNLTKIYLVEAFASYGNSNETYTTQSGQHVEKGDRQLVIDLTLRNDYSVDNPPPPVTVPISPADGTAYLFLSAILYNQNGIVNATDVSVPDFYLPPTSGTSLVLASGQTNSVTIYMATSQTDVTRYNVDLIFLGDSIPT